jgi:hypothetical protein
MGRHTKKPPKEAYDPDKVGYRNPPKKAQFPKGKSGNPKGRPAGSKGIKTDLKKVVATVRTIVVNGKEITGRTQWLMLEALALRGSYGDLKAIAQLLPLIVQVLGIDDRDIDPDRLSTQDEAMLERAMKRWDIATTVKPKRIGKSASAKPAREAGPAANPSSSRRKSVGKPNRA